MFINDDPSDEEDIPIAENIYSDASSDTELSDDEGTDLSNYTISSYPSVESLEEDLQQQEALINYASIMGIENHQNNHPRAEVVRPVAAESSTFAERSSPAPLKKFKNTAPRSRQGVGKKKARRIENGKYLIELDSRGSLQLLYLDIAIEIWHIL